MIKENDFINEENEKNENNTKKEKENENKKKEENKENKENEENNANLKKNEKKDNEKKENTDIQIGINIDNKYIYPCLVFLTSLLENRGPTTIYNIHILTGDSINKDYVNKINSLIKKYGKDYLKIKYYNMKDDFKGAITGSHISTAAYYRIALPSLLPNVDKIIYSDTDVINFEDLTEMYNLELKEKTYFMGTLDDIGMLFELRSQGIFTDKYMNSGILLMNLKAMRKDGIEQKIRKYIRTHYLDHHDQTAINAVCYNNFDILSIKYASFIYDSYNELVKYNDAQDKKYRYSETELKQAFYEPILLHYAGWVKPWDHGYSKSNAEYWWYYAKKSDFYKEILNHYGFRESDIEKLLQKIPEDGGLLRNNYKK